MIVPGVSSRMSNETEARWTTDDGYEEPNVKIHPSCKIGPGVQLGVVGFGYEWAAGRWPEKTWEEKPQSFGVVIWPWVHIGANSVVARGSYRDTEIGWGSKLDAMVFVAHNALIGRNCLIVAHTEISGSVVLGDGVILGPSVTVKEHITIGDNALIGAGAVVLRDVPPNEVWVGNPARFLRLRRDGEAI